MLEKEREIFSEISVLPFYRPLICKNGFMRFVFYQIKNVSKFIYAENFEKLLTHSLIETVK